MAMCILYVSLSSGSKKNLLDIWTNGRHRYVNSPILIFCVEDHLLHEPMIFKEGVQSLIGGNTGLLDQCSKLSYHSKKAVYTA